MTEDRLLGIIAGNSKHPNCATTIWYAVQQYIKSQNIVKPVLGEGQLDEAMALLAEYEDWEAMLLKDNAMWWPHVPKDRISGQTYDKMLQLQAKRNELLAKS
jgi:hypothetical protein